MNFHSNPVRFDTGRPMTEDEMRRNAPSIFAYTAHDSRSERFKPIPTIEILRGLEKEGFMPVSAKQSVTRLPDRRDFTKHMIRLRRFDNVKEYAVGDTVAEIVLKNANDGSSAYELLPGLFRIRCLNGMVAKLSQLDALKVRHSGDVQNKVIDGTYTVLEDAKAALAAPQDWSRIQLGTEERLILAESAHRLRFANSEGEVTTPIKPYQMLEPRRRDDVSRDLWTTFNVMQENAIRGGIQGVGRDANNRRIRRTSRPVNGIDQDVRLNRELFTLAAKMAELKGTPAV
jgi:hypothetical protein